MNIISNKSKKSILKTLFSLVLLLSFIAVLIFTDTLDYLKSSLDTEELTFKAGKFKFSLYEIFRSIIYIVLIFWSTSIVSGFIEKRIYKIKKLKAATRDLTIKLVQIFLYVIAFLVVLDVVGIDLTALTVFSGAAGIGLGFGLQKTASNFISGLILLYERIIEPGDLIEMDDGTQGFVKKTNARYTVIETWDSREIIVPNEDLMTNKVTNLTLNSSKGRLDIEVGISYKSDVHKAKDLILKAATEHKLCLKDPEPMCFMTEFGDSSVNFLLHFWIGDVSEGRLLPKSEVLFSIWDKFKENDIEIPFPQRDLHIKSMDATIKSEQVKLDKDK